MHWFWRKILRTSGPSSPHDPIRNRPSEKIRMFSNFYSCCLPFGPGLT